MKWLFLLAAPVCLSGQGMTDYALGVGRAGVLGGGVSAVGKSTAGAIEKSRKATDARPAAKPAAAPELGPPAPDPIPTPDAKTRPAPDPEAVPAGMEREELFAKFGRPSTRISSTEGADLMEKCWYKPAGRPAVLVTLRNGKVTSVVAIS